MIIFLGYISFASVVGTCCLRHLLRIATATARFACFCPMINLSNSLTICLGVMFFIVFYFI